MTTLGVAFAALALAALVALLLSRRIAGQTGLPRGRLLYSDTGFAVGKVSALERNGKGEKQEKPLVSKRYGLVGRPDYLVRTAAGVVPVEAKSSRRPAGGRPHDSHVFQLLSYCLLVEDVLGEPVRYGVLRYSDAEVELEYTPRAKVALLELLEEMREAEGLKDVHRSHEEPRRCAGCRMRDLCDEAL